MGDRIRIKHLDSIPHPHHSSGHEKPHHIKGLPTDGHHRGIREAGRQTQQQRESLMNANLWKVYLYELQLAAPNPKRVVCSNNNIALKPSYYGREFHGKISRGDADKLLSVDDDGRYLVRESIRSPGQYTLCLRFNHSTKNYRLHFFDGKHFFGDQKPGDDKKFDTLHDLVADVLISLYLELHAGEYIASLGNHCTYEESPYMTLHMTLHRKHRNAVKVGPKRNFGPKHQSHFTASSSGSSSSSTGSHGVRQIVPSSRALLGQLTPMKARYGLENLKISEYDEEDEVLDYVIEDDNQFLSNFHQTNSLDVSVVDVQTLEKAHVFKTHNFIGLPFCDFCGNFMWGLMGQGVKCQDCGLSAHKRCSEKIPPDCCPDLSLVRRVFGVDLTTLVKACNTIRPFVVDACIQEIEHRGLHVEGLYRMSGFADDVEYLKIRLEAEGSEDGDVTSAEYILRTCDDVHVVTGVLKMFFRLLPIPVITFDAYPLFVSAVKKATDFEKLTGMKEAISKLPPAHFQTLKYLLNHLVRVSTMSDENLMTPHNLATVFAPTLMRQPSSSGPLLSSVQKSFVVTPWQLDVEVVETLITSYSKLFK